MSGPATQEPSEPHGAATDQHPSLLKRRPVRIGLGVVLVLALVAGIAWGLRWWTVGRFVQSTNDAYLEADQLTVSPRISGYVEALLIKDNQAVAAGQPLVKIDPRDPQAKLDQALGQIAQGRAGILQAQAQIRQQQAQIAQARAQLAGSRAGADFAAQQVERYGPLAQSGAETAERLDQLRSNNSQAQAQSAASAAQVAAAERQVQTLRAQIALAQAQVQQAQAQAVQARVDVDAAVVRAGIAGRVGDRTVQVGDYVQPGLRLMSVVPVQEIYLTANFKETQIGRMRVGQPVEISLDALKSRKLSGVLDSFAPGTGAQFALIPPSNATGNFTKIVQRVPVRIRVAIPSDIRQVLVPGLSADVAVDTRRLGPARARVALNGHVR